MPKIFKDKISPDKETFFQKAKEGNLIPVSTELSADLDTPISILLKLVRPPLFLLESVEKGERLGRYSFIGEGNSMLQGWGKKLLISGKQETLVQDPFSFLKEYFRRWKTPSMPDLPPFYGGAVGYISYDMACLSKNLYDELRLPDCAFLFIDTFLVFDHVKQKLKVIANAYVKDDLERAYDEAVARIEKYIVGLTKSLPELSEEKAQEDNYKDEFESNFTREEFLNLVGRAKEYIASGDVSQVVLSQRLRRKTKAKPLSIYRALRRLNPSSHMFYLDFGNFQLIGSSPETLVKLEGNYAQQYPIAGTRPRGANEEKDQALIAELLSDPKERAEHTMLVDLAKDDLYRVCHHNTVKVSEFMTTEKYSHVIHIVSRVEGRLKEDADAFSLFQASFPAGTVVGAPKIRAMEIISELEKLRRGPYAGAVGYFSFNGNMDTCITIRTIIMISDTVYLQGGAGIVADSQPAREYEETLSKIKALEEAIRLAEGRND